MKCSTYFREFAERQFWSLLLVLLVLVFAFYQLLFLRVRAFDVDNSWFLSFSYNFGMDHIYRDTFMNVPVPRGMDGTHLFGKIPAAIQSLFLKPFAWQARPAIVLSSLFITASLGLLAGAAKRLTFPALHCLIFIATLSLTEPFVLMACRARYEPFALFFLFAGLLSATYGQTGIALFLATLAVETEPAAIMGFVPIVAIAVIRRSTSWFTLAWQAVLGGGIGLGIGLALHPDWHALRRTATTTAAATPPSSHLGALSGYFLVARHWPETLLFCVIAFLLCTRRLHLPILSNWLFASILGILVLSLGLPHPNADYAGFIYPFLVLATLEALPSIRWKIGLASLIAVYFLSQYSFLSWKNRGAGYTTADIAAVSRWLDDSARQAGLAPQSVVIQGDFRLWFAHPHLYRGNVPDTVVFLPTDDLIACFAAPPRSTPVVAEGLLYCRDFQKFSPPLRLLSTMKLHGDELYLYTRHPAKVQDEAR
jgi:hypothetical protein